MPDEITTDVLVQLAEKVMGYIIEDNRTFLYAFPTDGSAAYTVGARVGTAPSAAVPFSPHTNLNQAIDLLEGWCDAGPRRWAEWRRFGRDKHQVTVYLPDQPRTHSGAPTLPLAIVRAVCAAERIEIRDE